VSELRRTQRSSCWHRYLLGTFSLGDILTVFQKWGDTSDDHDVQALYACGAVLMAGAVCATCYFVPEVPLSQKQAEALPQQSAFEDMKIATKECPKPIARAWLVQFCHFFCFFTIFTFGTDYFGKFVYGGDSGAPKHSEARDTYNDGIKAGNLAMACQTGVSVLCNLGIPSLISMLGIKKLLLFSDAVLALCLFVLAFQTSPSRWPTTAIFALLGIPWATTTSVLWYIVGRACKGMPNAGLYNGLFNMSQCFPEMTISLVSAASCSRAWMVLGRWGCCCSLLEETIKLCSSSEHAALALHVPCCHCLSCLMKTSTKKAR